jgi:hypothetical protein
MKYKVLITVSLFHFLCSCQKNEKNTINSSREIVNTNNLDSVSVSQIPFGNPELINKFKKNGSNGFLTNEESNQLETINSKFHNLYGEIGKKGMKSFYKYPQKNILDFGLNYISPLYYVKTYQGYYSLARRLPDVSGNKIFIMNSTEEKEKHPNIFHCVDLVIYNDEKGIIDNLNLSFSLYASDEGYYNFYGDIDKYYYIDKNYTIHIKYFGVRNESNSTLLLYKKYKILKDGDIVQYFDEETGHYKNEVEEGEIQNHKKEGVWREALSNFQTNYCIKKYHEGRLIDNIEIVRIDDNQQKQSFYIDKKTYLPLK